MIGAVENCTHVNFGMLVAVLKSCAKQLKYVLLIYRAKLRPILTLHDMCLSILMTNKISSQILVSLSDSEILHLKSILFVDVPHVSLIHFSDHPFRFWPCPKPIK